MAQKFLTSINLTKNELQNAVIQNLATAPSSPAAGQIYYNTGDNKLYVYDGTIWEPLDGDIQGVTAGSGLTGGGTAGTVTLNVGAGDGISVAPDSISVNAEGTQFEFVSGKLTISNGAIGPDELASTAVTAGSYGSGTAIPTFTVDADGRLTAAGSVSVATTLNITGDTGSDGVSLLTETLNFQGGDGITTTVSDDNVLIVVDSTVVRTSGDQTIAGNKTFSNNVIINGDLTVSGATTTKISETVLIEDNIITLNSNETATPSENSGIEVERGTSTNVSLLWNESDDRWKFTNDGATFYNIPVPSEYDNFSFNVAVGATSQEVANAGTLTFAQGGGLTVGIGGNDTITFSHSDTSSQASVNNSGFNVIQDITLDTYGHITAIGSVDLTSSVEAAGKVTKKISGNGTATSFAIAHNFGTPIVSVQVLDYGDNGTGATYEVVYTDVQRSTDNAVTIGFAVAPTATQDYLVLISKFPAIS